MSSPVLIFANGRGTRMSDRADEPKTLNAVNGVPILAWLLREIRATAPRHLWIYLRHPHPEIDRLVAASGLTATIRYAEPAGYLVDLNTWREEQVSGFSVLDSDLVAPPGGVRAFLNLANQQIGRTGVAIGYTQDETPGDDRTIWISFTPDGLVRQHQRGGVRTGFASVGAYHWSLDALTGVDESLTRSRSVTQYLAELIAAGYPVTPLPIPGALNVNTPAQLVAARARAAAWSAQPPMAGTALRVAARRPEAESGGRTGARTT